MGVFTRRIIKEDLDKVNVFLEDTKNEIFVVQDLPDTFGQGRTAFKIFGSNFLKDNVPLKIEILDKSGETVYIAPVIYGTENPRLPFRFVSTEVYREINVPGEAKLVILGELDPSVINVPQEFQGTYNVKFSKTINIDTFTFKNTQPILFFKKPTFTAQEIVSPRKKVNPQTNTFISGSQIFGIVKDELRGRRFLSGYNVDSQIDTNEGGKSDSASGDVKAEVDTYKYKTGLFGKKAILSKRGLKFEMASEEPPQMRIFSNASPGPFTSKLVGGTIDVKGIQLTDAQKQELSGFDKSSLINPLTTSEINERFSTDGASENIPDFSAKIERVVNDRELITTKPYSVDFKDFGSAISEKIYSDIGTSTLNANFTASFIDWDIPTTSSFHFDSFVDIDLKNLRTFSGDIYRVKVYGASDESTADFPVLLDTVVESPELLRDTTSPSGFLRSGYFKDQTHIDKYWNGFAGDNTTNQFTSSFDSSLLIDGTLLSGSYSDSEQAGRFELDNTYSFTVTKDIPYTLSFRAKGKKTTKINPDGSTTKSGKLLFHLSGSNLSEYDGKTILTHSASFGATITDELNRPVGLEIDDTNDNTNNDYVDFGSVSHTFFPKLKLDRQSNTDTILQVRIDSGIWVISDVSLRPAQDTGFSPDEFSLRVPIPEGQNNEPNNFDFLVEYYDVDGNVAETATYINDVKISGSALIIQGSDNMITGSLFLGSLQGTGIEIHGGSAFLRAVGYQGFKSASAGQGGGFFIWSGSAQPGGETQDNYTGAGLEIHDGNTGVNESYFKFRTIDPDNSNNSTFDIKTSTFFLGKENPTNFVSGANGNIEISSSNFHLTPQGNVTMSGIITAEGGNIGDFQIIDGQISGSNITLNANNSTIFKTDQGPGSDSAAAFPQLRNEFYIDFSPTVENPDNFFVKFGPNFMVDKDGILIASGATFEGSITASKGLIGGFTSDDDSFFSGAKASPSFFISGSATGTGHTKSNLVISSSGFSVNSQGQVSASSGIIGGFSITDTFISGSNLIINSDGTLRTKNYDPNLSGWLISSRDNGFAEFENVKIRGTLRTAVFEKETVNAVGGQLYVANSTAITGSSVTPSTTAIQVDNVSGFQPNEVIFAKKVTGTGFTKEFMLVTSSSRLDPSSDNDFGGFLHVSRSYGVNVTGSAYSNATTLGAAITSTNSTVVTVASNSGLNRRTLRIGDELLAVSSSVGSTTINVRRGVSGTKKATHSNGATVQLLSRDAAIVANVVNPAESYDEGQVLVSTGRYESGTGNNTTGSGYIHLNANPGEDVTPYIDFAERTGSGIYDSKLRMRLGDLSGITNSRLGDSVAITANPGFGLAAENVFLSGQIKATSGSIGGINMESSKIFTGPGTHGGSTTGFFANSSGDFSLRDKFVFTNSSGNLTVNANSFDLNTTSLRINSSNGGTFAMGPTAPTELTASGIFLSGSGEFNFQQSASFVRGDSDGIEISFPNFGVTKTGILTATDGNFNGRIEAETGFFGSDSTTGWEIDGNRIKSVVTDANLTGSIEIDATPSSPNITLTSGSFTADIVPEFTTAANILSGGGSTYTGGTFTSGSNNNGVAHTSDVSSPNSSTAKDLFTAYSDLTTATFGTSVPTQSTGSNGFNYKSSVSGKAKIQIATPNINSNQEGAELFGSFTVTGTLKLFVNNSEITAARKSISTTISPSEFVAGPVVNSTVNFSTSHTHTLSGNHNLHWQIDDIQVTNNNLREYIILQSGGNFVGTTEIGAVISNFHVFFTDAKHIVSNKKTELAPAGFQSVKLTSTTLNSAENFYVRVAPEESKTFDILSEKVHLTGSLHVKANASANTGFIKVPNGTAGAPTYRFATNNTDGFYYPATNKIGVTIGSSQHFQFDGSANVFRSVGDIEGFSTSLSDIKFKENVTPLSQSLDKVKLLKGVEFDWKDAYKDRGHDIGFIAQDVEKVKGLEPLVKESYSLAADDDNVKVVYYDKVIPILVEAIKEQQIQIDELKKKLEVK